MPLLASPHYTRRACQSLTNLGLQRDHKHIRPCLPEKPALSTDVTSCLETAVMSWEYLFTAQQAGLGLVSPAFGS